MLKYAKIVNEQTKECNVGLGNPDNVFEERIIPEKSHKEVIPAEYDNEGNLIKEEEIVVVVDEEEHTEIITVGDWYKSIGMTEQEVEQAYNGSWYLLGYAPVKPTPTYEEVSETRKQLYTEQVDPITSQIQRLRDEPQTKEVIDEIEALKTERSKIVEKIKNENPYPSESLTSNTVNDLYL